MINDSKITLKTSKTHCWIALRKKIRSGYTHESVSPYLQQHCVVLTFFPNSIVKIPPSLWTPCDFAGEPVCIPSTSWLPPSQPRHRFSLPHLPCECLCSRLPVRPSSFLPRQSLAHVSETNLYGSLWLTSTRRAPSTMSVSALAPHGYVINSEGETAFLIKTCSQK